MLFSLACFTGAHEAKAPILVCEKLRRIGYNIGIAFQIIDDILDYSGNEILVRKPLKNDIAAGIVTLPVLCALPFSSALRDIFSKGFFTPDESESIYQLVRESGGAIAADTYAKTYTNRAIREIDTLPRGNHRDMLATLTRLLLIRDT